MNLKRISERDFNASKAGAPVICPVKNEIALLPYFLAHHREIGVSHFIFIDNGSTDGTTDYLLSQPDTVVFYTEDSFIEARTSMDWVERLLHTYCEDRWAIYLDCDEHLLFPEMDAIDINAYVERVAQSGADSVAAVLLDMYPKGSFLDIDVTSFTAPPRATMNYFDRDYVVRRRPKRPWAQSAPTALQILGGPRCRLLSDLSFEASRGWGHDMALGQIDRFVYQTPQSLLPPLFKHWPPIMPALQKRPLNKIHRETRYPNNHDSNNQRLHTDLLCLMHFKFGCEIQSRGRESAIALNRFRRGLEREQLRLAVEKWPTDSLFYEGSTEFRSQNDIAQAGLLGDSHAEILTADNPE